MVNNKNKIETKSIKKNILLNFSKEETHLGNVKKFLGLDSIYAIYNIDNYDAFCELMCSKKINKAIYDDYMFYLLANQFDAYIYKALKLFVKKGITNFKICEKEGYSELSKTYFKNYLQKKGVDITGEIIKIDNFIFDNWFENEFQGYIECGDLILPSYYNDYSMIAEGAYEYDEVTILKNDIVFDCGANIGSFSALALSKGGIVHAFEPIPKIFSLLNHYLRHYDQNNIYINNVGLSNKIDVIDFYIDNTNLNGCIEYFDKWEKLQCPIITIDEYVAKNGLEKIDFIKADVEGVERDLLNGAINSIKKYKPKLSICTYHSEDDPQIIENIIKDICSSYNIIHKWGKCYAFI